MTALGEKDSETDPLLDDPVAERSGPEQREATASEIEVTERRIRLPDGVELHLSEAGEGEPVLLLHGWPQDSSMWEPLVGHLGRERRVLVPDLRGFGRSDAPRGDYLKHQLAADILALLDGEGIERAAVVGHDWGGWVAWLLALEHPERVSRFAALDIPPPWRFDPSLGRLPLELLFASYQVVISTPVIGRWAVSSRRAIGAFIKGGSGPRRRISEADADRYARSIARPERSHVSVALYRTFLLRELPSIARGTYTHRELTVDGLSIMGGDSAITKLLGAPSPSASLRVEVLPDVGHFVVDEAPAEVLSLLEQFLRGAP